MTSLAWVILDSQVALWNTKGAGEVWFHGKLISMKSLLLEELSQSRICCERSRQGPLKIARHFSAGYRTPERRPGGTLENASDYRVQASLAGRGLPHSTYPALKVPGYVQSFLTERKSRLLQRSLLGASGLAVFIAMVCLYLNGSQKKLALRDFSSTRVKLSQAADLFVVRLNSACIQLHFPTLYLPALPEKMDVDDDVYNIGAGHSVRSVSIQCWENIAVED